MPHDENNSVSIYVNNKDIYQHAQMHSLIITILGVYLELDA